MSTPFLSEIKLVAFNFPPRGWAFCNGQTLPINQYQALFALLGTTFGGNGTSTFQLPNLQGRAAMHFGGGFSLGEVTGQESVTLIPTELPVHNHVLEASNQLGTQPNPSSHVLAEAPLGLGNVYGTDHGVLMNNSALAPIGDGAAHNNMQPYLVLNYIISLTGIFPSQN